MSAINRKNKYENGFVALISAILLSSMLLLVAIVLSTSSFFARFNILGSELKEKGLSVAEACADEGLLLIANNENHISSTTTNILGVGTCTLGPIPTSGNPRIFFVESNIQNYYTNLKISVSPSTLLVNSWEEI
jgi:hypothetical protein